MPAYTVTAPVGQLSSIQKQRLAMEITRVHCDVTGAPSYFVQVIFNDVPEGNYFRAARVIEGSHNVYVLVVFVRDATAAQRSGCCLI
jgi:phenylpyruvate tautomerase PptA (4-oxalocrotonate tautomerase family)